MTISAQPDSRVVGRKAEFYNGIFLKRVSSERFIAVFSEGILRS